MRCRAGPLPTLAALLAWEPSPDDAGCRGSVPLEGEPLPPTAPRVLACHDMAGGYHADAAVPCGARGGGDAYAFHHWPSIDVFCYFSHALVTIPPPAWIDAAHAHGVACVGTLIFEWDAGAAAIKAATATPAAADAVAAALARVAAHFRFDGWLLNVEVPLPRACVPNLVRLIASTRAAVRAAVGPHALTIWYDAVTIDGKLRWQNGLTRANAPFAAAADALFLNYSWKPPRLAASVLAAQQMGAFPPTAIFAGADVWGRGSYGGAGPSGVATAAAAAAAAGTSLAVFAPAWAYEAAGAAGHRGRADALWCGVDAAFRRKRAPFRRPARLPFFSAFFGGTATHWTLPPDAACAASTGGWWGGGAADPAPLWQATAAVALAFLPDEAARTVALALSVIEGAVLHTGGAAPDAPDAVSAWPPAPTARVGGAVLALRGAIDPRAPPADTLLFEVHVPHPPPGGLVATAAVRGAATLVLTPETAPPVPLLPSNGVDADDDNGWTTLTANACALPSLAGVGVRWPAAPGPFYAVVGAVAVAPAGWTPPPSPAAGTVSVAPVGPGRTTVSWSGGPARGRSGVARWSVWVERAGGGGVREWVGDAVSPLAIVEGTGGAVLVRALFADGSVEAVEGAGRARLASAGSL